MLREYLASSATWLPFHETTFADYAAGFPPTSVNVILQVGHNTLRLMTAGLENRPLTPDEMAAMERLLEEALAGGAWGLSSGLFTAPGNFADAAEIHALARVLRRRRRRLLDARARRGRSGLRGGAGGDRRRRGHRRARPDRAPQALGRRQLGRGRPAARRDRGRAPPRAACRLRRLSLRHRHQPAAQPAPPLGDGGRHPGDARAARPPRRAHAHPRRHRAERAHQLRAHPVLGRRARGHLAAPARPRRPHPRRHRAQPRRRRHRRRRRLPRGRSRARRAS